MLKAGELRHRIDIQQKLLTKDSNGNEIEEWESVYSEVPAAVRPLSVGQFIAASAAQSKIEGRFVIRYAPGLDATQRVVENGIVYDVHGWLPDPDSGLEYVTAPFSRGVNNGGF